MCLRVLRPCTGARGAYARVGLTSPIIVTSDGKEKTLLNEFKMLKNEYSCFDFLLQPSYIMTDDSRPLQNVRRKFFANSKFLLCIFHVMQAK